MGPATGQGLKFLGLERDGSTAPHVTTYLVCTNSNGPGGVIPAAPVDVLDQLQPEVLPQPSQT